MTDGGPEHPVNFESVKIRLIIRTIPGQSYVNIVERMMSTLNMLQNVVLEQKESPSNEEIKFQN